MGKNKVRIKKDDTVEIVTGKDKSKRGSVVKVFPNNNSVIVRGLNMVSKAMRRKSQQDKGGIIEVEAPIDVSNVMIICKKCGKTRVGYDLKDGKKIRICRKCGDKL
ncbi:MAG: 50S ribosomal protein L24 [Treponema sp.]|nr:MAG: 50S ribosomal protein L24 [Treponema sp.]